MRKHAPEIETSPSGQAFTLIEVMIALAIMAMALASSAICLRMGMMQYDTARATNYATQVLQNEAERLRLLNWSSIEGLPGYGTFGEDVDRNGKFTFRRYFENADGSGQIKRIWLIAEWSGLTGESRRLRLMFSYARNGTYDYYYGASG